MWEKMNSSSQKWKHPGGKLRELGPESLTDTELLAILISSGIKPRLCSRRRSEAQKTSARREVGAILCRKHIHKYVEKQNRETSVATRIFKPQ